MAPNKHDERIKALETKLAQAKALRAKEEARARTAEAAAKRTADTRRKVLAGAAVLAEVAEDPERMDWLNSVLARRLTRPDERKLFGLAPLPTTSTPPRPSPAGEGSESPSVVRGAASLPAFGQQPIHPPAGSVGA